jgi:hypothetical protein
LLFFRPVGNRLASRSMGRAAAHRCIGLLFNKLPRTRLHNWVRCAFAPKADIAQQAERDHAMVEAPGSMPGIRSNLIAGVLRHNGRACVPGSAGTAWMCAAGTPARVQRERFKRGTALALEHNRNEIMPA